MGELYNQCMIRKSISLGNLALLMPIALFPIVYLNWRHTAHICLFTLLIISLYFFIQSPKKRDFLGSVNKLDISVFISLSSLTIATGLQQTLTGTIHFPSYDGPSKLLAAGFIFLFLIKVQNNSLNFHKVIELAIPIGLLATLTNLSIHTEWRWGERWANYFVDPNTLGSQAAILTGLCIFTIRDFKKDIGLNLIKLLGTIAGIALTIKAQSRGGFIAIPFMFITWFILNSVGSHSYFNLKERSKLALQFSTIALMIISIGIFTPEIQTRISHTIYEVKTWLIDPTIYTSAGSRLSMWVAALQLINENWWGYGEVGIKHILQQHPIINGPHAHGVRDMIFAGPHSDLLSKGLSLGLLGIASYLSLLFIPLYICWQSLSSINNQIKSAAQFGILYIVGVFITGLFNEMLSLKYLCSFYGLMIACILATILGHAHDKR